jgi:hypothetical protein
MYAPRVIFGAAVAYVAFGQGFYDGRGVREVGVHVRSRIKMEGERIVNEANERRKHLTPYHWNRNEMRTSTAVPPIPIMAKRVAVRGNTANRTTRMAKPIRMCMAVP